MPSKVKSKKVKQGNNGMRDDDVVSLVMSELQLAKDDAERNTNSSKALGYYRQERDADPVFEPQDGRSGLITSEVRDTVDAIVPQIMDMYFSSDEIVEFVPEKEEDIDQAKQESRFVKYVFERQNEGFYVFQEAVKDALIQKNGILKVFWEEKEEELEEYYERINLIEYQQLLSDDNVEVVEFSIVNAFGEEVGGAKDLAPEFLLTSGADSFNARVKIKKDISQVKVIAVPLENFFVAKGHDSLDLSECHFCAHRIDMTRGELVGMGYDKSVVDDLSSSVVGDDMLKQARWSDQGGNKQENVSGSDKSRDNIQVIEAYIKMDYDGSGIDELRKLTIAGNQLLDNVKVDCNPFVAITPIIEAHRFWGTSAYDLTFDLQELSTVINRQTVDNLYLTNEPMYAVAGKNENTIDDLLVRRLGGIVRTDDVNHVKELGVSFFAGSTLPYLDVIEKMREERTGVNKTSMGLNPEALANANNPIGIAILNSAQLKIKMMASNFAFGYKRLMLKIHELVQKHESNEVIADLGDGYISVDPRSWKKRRDMRIKVGIGSSSKQEKMAAMAAVKANITQIVEMQGGIQGPFVNADNIHNVLVDEAELAGVLDSARYYSDPADFVPPQQEEETDIVDIAELELTTKAMTDTAKLQLEQQKHQDEMLFKQQELELEERKQALKEAEFQVEHGQLKLPEPTETRKSAGIGLSVNLPDAAIDGLEAITEANQQIVSEMEKKEAQRSIDNIVSNRAILSSIEELKRPKEIIRDSAGNITGVKIKEGDQK